MELWKTIIGAFFGGGLVISALIKLWESRLNRKDKVIDEAAAKSDKYTALKDEFDQHKKADDKRFTELEAKVDRIDDSVKYGLQNLDNKLNDALRHVEQSNDALFAQSINSLDYRCQKYILAKKVTGSELRNLNREFIVCKKLIGVEDEQDDPDILYISNQIKKVERLPME